VVGNHTANIQSRNLETMRRNPPLSGYSAGFGDSRNWYAWSMAKKDGVLYLGTMNGILPKGGDLWKSPNGVDWTPVMKHGFGKPENYGVRTMVPTDDGLYVGMANPHEGDGLEIWKANGTDTGTGTGTDTETGTEADEDNTNTSTPDSGNSNETDGSNNSNDGLFGGIF
ncbi:MAG: hypothetical protein SXQ77_08195, partial [Halobacteria archaeon]|nr:hypothetical protein [Halobacteria archaeon]